jgi:putative spermidine/putrescine transport system permease protein
MIRLTLKACAAITVVVWTCSPFVVLAMWSLSQRWFFPDLWPEQWGLRAWGYVFGTAADQITLGLLQSLQVACVTAAIAVVVGYPAGRALGLYQFRGKAVISMVLTLPIVVPPLCVAMGLHLWFLRLHLAETFWGVVMVHLAFSLPYAIFVLWGVFSNYNPDFEAQARSLGASSAAVVWRVMIPMTFSGILVAALFSFLLSWSQYLSTLIIGGGKLITLPILLFSLMGSGDRPVAAAVSLIFIVPAFVALLFSAHHLGKGQLKGIL